LEASKTFFQTCGWASPYVFLWSSSALVPVWLLFHPTALLPPRWANTNSMLRGVTSAIGLGIVDIVSLLVGSIDSARAAFDRLVSVGLVCKQSCWLPSNVGCLLFITQHLAVSPSVCHDVLSVANPSMLVLLGVLPLECFGLQTPFPLHDVLVEIERRELCRHERGRMHSMFAI